MSVKSKKAKKITQKDVMKGVRKKMPPPVKAFDGKGYKRNEKHKPSYNEGMTFKDFYVVNEQKCWKGYRKVGKKKKGNKIVNDCKKM
jgi:hypothetical protein